MLYARLKSRQLSYKSESVKVRPPDSQKIIRGSQRLLEIVREFDKLKALKPEVIKVNFNEITNDYVLTIWREGAQCLMFLSE